MKPGTDWHLELDKSLTLRTRTNIRFLVTGQESPETYAEHPTRSRSLARGRQHVRKVGFFAGGTVMCTHVCHWTNSYCLLAQTCGILQATETRAGAELLFRCCGSRRGAGGDPLSQGIGLSNATAEVTSLSCTERSARTPET